MCQCLAKKFIRILVVYDNLIKNLKVSLALSPASAHPQSNSNYSEFRPTPGPIKVISIIFQFVFKLLIFI